MDVAKGNFVLGGSCLENRSVVILYLGQVQIGRLNIPYLGRVHPTPSKKTRILPRCYADSRYKIPSGLCTICLIVEDLYSEFQRRRYRPRPSFGVTQQQIRFLVLSDTHDHAFPDPASLPAVDVLIHCGDLTMIGGLSNYRCALESLATCAAETKLVIPGNHDVARCQVVGGKPRQR